MSKINKLKHSKKRRSFSLFNNSNESSLSNSLNLLLNLETGSKRISINFPKYNNQKYKNQYYYQLKSIDINNYNRIININIYLQRIVIMINNYK